MLKYRNKINNAKERNIEWKLSFGQFKKILRSRKCAYTGVKFDLSDEKSPHYITLDRINSSVGYIPGNVVACTHIANKLKASVESTYGTRNNVSYKSYEEALKVLSTCVSILDNKES